MAAFYYDTCTKLREIFSEHCNLSMEQYEEISGQLIDLVADYQENEPEAEIEKREDRLKVIYDFLFNTKELTLKEHLDLYSMLDEMHEQAERKRAEEVRKAVTEGMVL